MKALIIVDLQNDFMPTGALPVPQGDQIISHINAEMQKDYSVIVATQDWHPANHKSFASQHVGKKPFDIVQLNGIDQILWPDHCVQGTFGAELHKDLDTRCISAIFRKGMNPEIDSYSAFFDNNKLNNTGLHGYLQDKGIKELVFCGLAGDFCVAYSANDAKALGYEVKILENCVKYINN